MKTLHRRSMKPVALVAALMSCAVVTPAIAASDVFLELTNPEIKGSSTDAGHKDWIDVSSTHYTVTAATSWLKGSQASIGKPVAGVFSWTQSLDRSVPSLATQISTGKAVETAKFDFTKQTSSAIGAAPTSFMKITTKGAYLTDLSYAFTAGEAPQVDASIVYKSIEFAYQVGSSDGKPDSTLTTSWDIQTGKVTAPVYTAPKMPGTNSRISDSALFLRFASETEAIAGESTVRGYENWIQISDATWGLSAESSWSKSGGASVGKPLPDAFSWTQSMDRSVLSTLAAIAGGKALPTATFEYVVNGRSGPVTLMQMVMERPYLTSLELADGTVRESMVFKSIKQTLWSLDEDGLATAPLSYALDFPSGQSEGLASPSVTGFGRGALGSAVAAASVEAPLPAAPIPEPGTWAMMLGGLAVLGCAARARRQTA
jgi:type VI secretion system Hcp family effector